MNHTHKLTCAGFSVIQCDDFYQILGVNILSLKVIDECSVIVHCEEMSEGDGMSPSSESKRASKWK